MTKSYNLTDLQIDILQVLWDTDGATTADVLEGLRPGRRLAHSTVATLLSRLTKKGVIRYTAGPRGYVYHAAVSRHEVRRAILSRVSRSFRGDAAAMVSQLLDESKLEPDELARLRKLIDERVRKLEDS